MELNEEIKREANTIKLDMQFAIIIATATGAPYVAIEKDKAVKIFKLMDEIAEGREAET